MATRKRTIRKMTPTSRKLAKLCNDLESVLRRLRNMQSEITTGDLAQSALAHEQKVRPRSG